MNNMVPSVGSVGSGPLTTMRGLPGKQGGFRPGDRVRAFNNSGWWPAAVSQAGPDGSLSIMFDGTNQPFNIPAQAVSKCVQPLSPGVPPTSAMPSPDPEGVRFAEMEASLENKTLDQVKFALSSIGGVSGPSIPSPAQLAQLPRNGQRDELLRPGNAQKLFMEFTTLFRNDPPVMCGINSQSVGLSCASFPNGSYGTQVFSPGAVADCLQLSRKFWPASPSGNVTKLSVPSDGKLVIVGDTHGQLEDVLWIFFKYGLPSVENRYLFNGDIIDRGGHALEILLLLFCYMRDIPDSIHINRGNHEDPNCALHYGFRAEMGNKYADHYGLLWNLCHELVFPLMPIAALVNNGPDHRMLIVHGGIPTKLPGQTEPVSIANDLGRVNRCRVTLQNTEGNNLKDYDSQMLFQLLWCDPVDTTAEVGHGQHGRGNQFLESDTLAFRDHNQISFIIRSHQVPTTKRGWHVQHSGLCYTVFSASNYIGQMGNRGGVMVCVQNPPGLHPYEHWAPTWPHIAAWISRSKGASIQDRWRVIRDWEHTNGIDDKNGGYADLCPHGNNATITKTVSTASIPTTGEADFAVRDSGFSSTSTGGNLSPHKVNDKVQVRRSSGAWEEATVIQVHADGGLTVQTKDGGQKIFTVASSKEHIRKLGESTGSSNALDKDMLSQTVDISSMGFTGGVREEVVEYMMNFIVEQKDQLFEKFIAADRDKLGTLSCSKWSEVMLKHLGPLSHVLTPELLKQLQEHWIIREPVPYAQFLHRFQLKDTQDASVKVDFLTQVSMARRSMTDLSAKEFCKMLDPNGDKWVSDQELQVCLGKVGIEVPRYQAAALYEMMTAMVGLKGNQKLTVDDTIMCLALVSLEPVKVNAMTPAAQHIGLKLREQGQTFAGVFRQWDVDKDGFLSAAELSKGLGAVAPGVITKDEVQDFVKYVDEMGNEDGRVSIFEFVRAVAPREFGISVQRWMSRDLLKRVWLGRATLQTMLAQMDKNATQSVSVKDFRAGVSTLSQQLASQGYHPLSEAQIEAVCEIAANGQSKVPYDRFLKGLHVVDMDSR